MRVRFTDLDGKVHEEDAEGLFATCIQHEIDHLNGVLFVDYLSKLKRDRVLKKFTKAAKRGGVGQSSSRRLPGLDPGIHVFGDVRGVDGRDKPGHDDEREAFEDALMPLRLIFMGTPDFAVPTLLRTGRRTAMRSRPSIPARQSPAAAAACSCSRRRSSRRRGGSAFPC